MVTETRAAARKRKLAEADSDPDPPLQSTTPADEESDEDASPQIFRPAKRARPLVRRAAPLPSKATPGNSRGLAKASPAPRSSRAPKITRTAKTEKERRTRCNVCMEFRTTDSLYKCLTCKADRSCTTCLQQEAKTALAGTKTIMSCWRCQTVVPISATSADFKRQSKPEDLFMYSLRAEEKVDGKPLYCPKPRCSAFIPPRLYATTRPSAREAHERINRGVDRHKRRQDFFAYFGAELAPTACCPTCFTVICTSCRKEYHGEGDECGGPESLEGVMGGVKQCPFCHTAVEHAGGCPVVGCACGQYFCIHCQSWPCLCGDD